MNLWERAVGVAGNHGRLPPRCRIRDGLGLDRLPPAMPATESGTYRVLPGSPETGTGDLTLLERGTEEPIFVRADGYDDDLQATVDDLGPGNLIAATVEWPAEGRPVLTEVTVETETVFEFVDDADHVFEQAERTFEQGLREQTPIAANTTYSTDGEPNGALYTFAKQDGEKDIFAELRDGRMTLEPMIDRLGDGDAEPPYEVFVIRPVEARFVIVFLTVEPESLLPNTIRDEYDRPRA